MPQIWYIAFWTAHLIRKHSRMSRSYPQNLNYYSVAVVGLAFASATLCRRWYPVFEIILGYFSVANLIHCSTCFSVAFLFWGLSSIHRGMFLAFDWPFASMNSTYEKQSFTYWSRHINVLQKHKKQIYVQRCIAEANIFCYKKLNCQNTSVSFLQTMLKAIMISSSVPEMYTRTDNSSLATRKSSW